MRTRGVRRKSFGRDEHGGTGRWGRDSRGGDAHLVAQGSVSIAVQVSEEPEPGVHGSFGPRGSVELETSFPLFLGPAKKWFCSCVIGPVIGAITYISASPAGAEPVGTCSPRLPTGPPMSQHVCGAGNALRPPEDVTHTRHGRRPQHAHERRTPTGGSSISRT